MPRPTGLIERRLESVALDRVRHDPVIALQGPRAVGKSTLLRALADKLGGRVVDLDDPEMRDAVERDPGAFVRGDGPVCIDEYQHVPEVLDVIKAELNRDTRPGRFILTGSTRYDALPRATQSLTGRIHVATVRPLSQVEIERRSGNFVADVLADSAATVRGAESTTSPEEYIQRVTTGGFPLALATTPRQRPAWFENYVAASIQRDIRELAMIRQADGVSRLLERLAAQTGQVLNISNAASAAGIEVRTANTWEKLLEALFLIHRLPAWGRTAASRVGRLPKIHATDSGVAAYLQRLTPERLGRRTPTAMTEFGHLLETFVVNELLAQASWLDDVAGAGHWRTRGRDEVDLVVERYDGMIAAFEIKASTRVRTDDFKGLRALRAHAGDDFLSGVVLYTGRHGYATDDGLYVAPIDRLWCE